MRRLPVYILIQTSGAMRGEPIEAIKVGLETMVTSLRQDPFALESVYISIITFNRHPEQILSLTELENMQIPTIKQPEAAGTHLGEALKFVCQKMDDEVILSTPERKGDWMPLLFIMCNGSVSDPPLFDEAVAKIKERHFGSIVVCLVGAKPRTENVKQFTDKIVNLDTTDGATFRQFFKWVSASVSVGNRSVGATDEILLPPPPPEVHTVI
ncbi:MAG: VWA domain-containing protein [Candidatus Azobacteroides sp.]|nr:VWA domain-containing protein [Candidatus Azobacteroides sp.]